MKRDNQYEYACNIKSHYVGDDCIQVMLPYKKAVTVVDENGVLFHKKKGSYLTINKYLNDKRKEKFPYSNIPEHKMITPMGIIRYTNQLLEFNKPYIIITNGHILEEYAVKNKDDAILVTKCMVPKEENKLMTLDELNHLVYSEDSIDMKFSFDGGIWSEPKIESQEDKVIRHVREYFFDVCTKLNYGQLLSESGQSLKGSNSLNDSLCSFIKENHPLEDILEVFVLHILTDCISVYKGDNGIAVKAFDSIMQGVGKYQTKIYDFPVSHYSKEEAKSILQTSNNKTAKEPRISRIINKGIDRDLVKQEKTRVKQLLKNKR